MTSREDSPPERAILFIDGSNWYHGLRENGVYDTFKLNYAKISTKLVGPRDWIETRYYGAKLDQSAGQKAYADNRRFHSTIQTDDDRISVHLGRVERRPSKNPLAAEVLEYLLENRQLMSSRVEGQLRALANKHTKFFEYREKGVDVMLAVDMYRLAAEDRYDAAYLLSADGDFVPAVDLVVELGKTVYAACPNFGSALNQACSSFISMKADWFSDCYR